MKLNRTQWMVIGGAVVLLLAIYLFADTMKPHKDKPAAPMANRDGGAKDEPTFDWQGYMAKVKANISNADTLKLLAAWEKQGGLDDLLKLRDLYKGRGESVAEAYYMEQLALKENELNGKKDTAQLAHAGDLYGATSAISNEPAMHKYLIDKVVESYQKLVEWDSSRTDNRIKLASAYMDQGTAPMQGVSILLEIVAKNPNNADAQFMLGKFGIVSGQFDKAIVRLEKVVSLRPQNYDALFLLAEAYRGKGDKTKAVELLKRCVALVNKPELKKEIEQYIKKIQQ